VTLLDTPGHAAFFHMRDTGARVADFILLLIDANEGVQSQTKECLEIAERDDIPVIVAINKIDIADKEKIANVYKQLHDMGALNKSITPETSLGLILLVRIFPHFF